MRFKTVCEGCDGSGCDSCNGSGYAWKLERDPEVSCQWCGESFRERSEEAEFIGWNGKCARCELSK